MAFQFEKASCVVVGTFNMYILHPQWLMKREIIDTDAEVAIETNLTRPGFRFRFPKEGVVWTVMPSRLAVESEDPKIDCGTPIARVLQALPETPLFALGGNVHYRADLSELENLTAAIRDFPRVDPPAKGQSVTQRTFHTAVKRNEHETLNLQLIIKEDDIELACNVHNELGDRENANEPAVAAAGKFFDDLAEAETLARHTLGALIDHGPDNS